ncbi:MAG TPA: glutamate-5-semialdehyde dehydrogenase [Firmicutes bacterium]|nr:glutamate-5-semialdehyde dehydrogenase [Bacillota bacterium]
MDIKKYIQDIGKEAKKASYLMIKTGAKSKNSALKEIAGVLDVKRENILFENRKDVEAGTKKGLSKAFIDRLTLTEERIDGMIKVLADVRALKDPVGGITGMSVIENGLRIGKMRMPLGVVGFIFESRPNVCIEASALAIKSSNAIILRGGSDAANSNKAIIAAVKEGIKKAKLPENAVQLIENTDREAVNQLLKMKDHIDVIIPRGGYDLIKAVEEKSMIPVIRHDAGICHTYIHRDADIKKAVEIAYNAKVNRPGVCNAMETMLVHGDIAKKFLPAAKEYFDKAKVELRGCEKTRAVLKDIKEAVEEDWKTEYLDLILSIKVTESMDEAITHINTYGSHHSDAIVTESYEDGMRFINEVDSAACYINASTRFTDGNVFGLGAEIGISNQKLHVRGPMALEGLTSEKFIILGNGQIRE